MGLSDDGPLVLSLGALTDEKDPLEHAAIGSRVLGRHPTGLHLIVGDGPLQRATERWISTHGVPGRQAVRGPMADVRTLFAAADVLLIASRTEGMPAVAIEAGMAGLPVVAYDVGGVGEVIQDGRTGIIVPPRDRLGIVDALDDLLSSEGRRRSLGAAAEARCKEEFDIERVAERYLEVYADISSRRR